MPTPDICSEKLTTDRIILTWAFAEVALGGLLHALRIPFTGITVGSASVLCLCLLGFSVTRPREIFQGLAIVLAVKAAVTPHAPAGAFLAVAFQGLAAWCLFRFIGRTAVACVLLGALALVQSALQKLIFMTLLYGLSLWQAVDMLTASALKFFGIHLAEGADPSKWLIISYLVLHLLVGLVVGLIGARLPAWIQEGRKDSALSQVLEAGRGKPAVGPTGRSPHIRRKRLLRRAAGLILAAITVGIVIGLDGPGQSPARQAAIVLLRVAAVALLYLFLIAPLVRIGMRHFTRRETASRPRRISKILEELPRLRPMALEAWKLTKATRAKQPFRILRLFLAAVLFPPETARNKPPKASSPGNV